MKKIKVLHLISSFKRGGRERQLCNIVKFSSGIDIENLVVYFNDIDNSYIEEYNFKDIVIKIEGKSFVKRLKGLKHTIDRLNPDLIYSWGNFESIFIFMLKLFNNFIFINGSIRHGIPPNKISHYLRKALLHMSRYIIANSKAGLKANNLKKGFVLYNGIDDDFLSSKLKNKTRLIDNKNSTLNLISVANLVPYKDYLTVFKALYEMKNESFRFNYKILGDGPMKKELQDKILEYDLSDDIKILGNVTNVKEHLGKSDLLIHSSKGEGCSNAILEAMACGLPILASNTGGTNEILNKTYGWLFKYKDKLDLKENLYRVFSNKDKLIDMGFISRNEALKTFNMQKMIENYNNIILEIYKIEKWN